MKPRKGSAAPKSGTRGKPIKIEATFEQAIGGLMKAADTKRKPKK